MNAHRLDLADWYDKERDLVQCQACGKREEVYPSVAARRLFCSHRCAGLARERAKRGIDPTAISPLS